MTPQTGQDWMGQPLFDPATLETLAQDAGADVVGMLVDEFLCEMQKRVAAIVALSDTGDIEKLGFEAHALKSISSTYGAARLGRRAAVIERAARDGERDSACAAVEGILPEAEATVAAFRDAFV